MRRSCKIRNTDSVTLARVARWVASGWGEVNSQKKMRGKNVWYFSCSGHGGYVVLVPDGCNEVNIPEKLSPIDVWGEAYLKAYLFEEDCDWALLEYLNQDIKEWAKKNLCTHLTAEKHEEYIFEAVVSYNHAFVKPEDKDKAFDLLTEHLRVAFKAHKNRLTDMKYTNNEEYHFSHITELNNNRNNLCKYA